MTTSNDELSEARRTIVELEGLLAAAHRDRDDMRRRMEAAIGRSERDREQLLAIRRSRSWRLSAPLRVIRRQSE